MWLVDYLYNLSSQHKIGGYFNTNFNKPKIRNLIMYFAEIRNFIGLVMDSGY